MNNSLHYDDGADYSDVSEEVRSEPQVLLQTV